MERKLIEKYKQEMLKMYNSVKKEPSVTPKAVSTVAETEAQSDSTGGLLAVVTTIDRLYPVNNAKVTVFSGDLNNMQVIDTDNSGRSKVFILPTPQKQLSLESENTQSPYSTYNMMATAEGYLDNIHLNIPVFSGVTSVQGSNLMLKETAGVDKNNIYDESQKYNL